VIVRRLRTSQLTPRASSSTSPIRRDLVSKCGAIERQLEGADVNAVSRQQRARTAQPRAVDISAVDTAEIAQYDGAAGEHAKSLGA
jgi:hypothetical protein